MTSCRRDIWRRVRGIWWHVRGASVKVDRSWSPFSSVKNWAGKEQEDMVGKRDSKQEPSVHTPLSAIDCHSEYPVTRQVRKKTKPTNQSKLLIGWRGTDIRYEWDSNTQKMSTPITVYITSRAMMDGVHETDSDDIALVFSIIRFW